MSKKVKIIGAGIAGLATGCYLQLNGYETEIFEKHNISGGLCTGWKKGDYNFDGSVHWLLGSSEGSAFYKLWNELIPMKQVKFINHDLRVVIEVKNSENRYGDKNFILYSNVNKLEQYLLDLSPEDEKIIKEFIDSIKYIQKYEIPPLVEKAPEVRTLFDKLTLIKYTPLLLFLKKWGKVTNYDFAKRFKSPFLREAFELFFEGEEFSILAMTMQLAYYSLKCAGYPIGGSLTLANLLETKYLELGGKIQFNKKVTKINVVEDQVTGIMTEDNQIESSDIVISAADWNFTIFTLLEGNYVNQTILDLQKEEKLKVFDSAMLISLGISRSFDEALHLHRFPIDELTSFDGSIYKRLEVHTYNYDKTLAPDGKTVISITLQTKNPEYWIDLRRNDYEKYKKNKEELATQVIDILENKIGNIKEHIEVIDIASPATFYRYTNNWKGSIQGWLPSKDLFSASPVKNTVPNLNNFYLVGHWLEPGGGLPIALLTGRNIAQVICKKDKKNFKNILNS